MSVFLACECGGGGVINRGIACPCSDIVGFIRAVCGGVIADNVEHTLFSFSSFFLVIYKIPLDEYEQARHEVRNTQATQIDDVSFSFRLVLVLLFRLVICVPFLIWCVFVFFLCDTVLVLFF